MIPRTLKRWTLSFVIALAALGAIGLILNRALSVEAAGVTRIYPGLPPCDTSLQACIDGSAPGDMIRIQAGTYITSVTLDKPVSLSGAPGATPTIIQALSNLRVLTVTGAITPSTIISSLIFMGGNLPGTLCPESCGGAILITDTARPSLQNLTISGGSAYRGGGVYVDVGPDIIMSNVNVVNNTSQGAGGGIYADTTLKLNGGRIERNTSGDNGGGVYVATGLNDLFANSTVFVSNTASNGGGAHVASNAYLNFGRFEGNSSNWGGGLFASALTLTGTEFISNSATGNYGGGAYVNGPVVLNGGKFERNRSDNLGSGGGLYAQSLTAINTKFFSNTATSISVGGAGGAHINSGPAILQGVTFSGNDGRSGGGLSAGGPVEITDSSFISNTTPDNGGGMNAGGNAVVIHSKFERNTSAAGGGLYAASALAVTNSFFINNQAGSGGGLSHSGFGGGRIVNSLFARNNASVGAALQLMSAGTVDVIHTTIADSISNTASAVEVLNGLANITNTIIGRHAIGINVFNSLGNEDYNLFFGNVDNVIGANSGGHSFTTTAPGFIDPLHDNYHLRFDSDAIDRGADMGVTFDVDNQLRPIGLLSDIGYDEAPRSIQEAIDLALPGDTVYIPSGAYTESLTLYKPVSLIGIGGAPPTIHAVTDQRVLTITGAAITNSTVVSGLLLMGGNITGTGGGILITNNAMPTLRDMQVRDNVAQMGGGLYIDTGGVQLLDSNVTHNQALQSGGGVYAAQAGAYLEQQGGTIDDNRAVDGAGVFVQNGLYHPVGTMILSNTASRWGGGVYIDRPGAGLIQSGGIIGLNHAQDGGGVKIADGSYTLLDGQVYGNSAVGYGGGVFVDHAPALMTQQGGAIENNSAQWGGGVYVISGAVSFGGASSIVSNTAQRGGGVYLQDGDFNMRNGAIVSNTANNGGGVYIEQPRATFTQSLGLIGGNHAQFGSGGGLFVENGYALLYDGQIVSNTADNNGGGVYVMGGKLKLAGLLQIIGNAAIGAATTGKGGGLYAQAGFVQLIGGRFVNNAASTDGGGVYAATDLMITGTKFFRNTANDGGAIYHTGSGNGRVVNVFVAGNSPTAANAPGASLAFNSTGYVYLLHGTLANSTTAVGQAIGVNDGVVNIYNTIVASYTTGISQTGGAVTEDYNLYFGNLLTSTGTITHGVHDLIGLDPQFVYPILDNYHIRGMSPAVNRGTNVGVRRDIDFEARPLGGAFDIGADEAAVSAANIVPGLGGTMTYTSPQGSIIQVNIPPGAVTVTLPIYCSLIDSNTISLPPRLILSGSIFELDGYPDPETTNAPPPIFFNVPVTLTVTYTDTDVAGIDETRLKLYRFEPNGIGWRPIGYRPGETQTIDINNNVITATILGFSKFGRMGAESGYELFLPIVLRN